jgi:hypothetical protein
MKTLETRNKRWKKAMTRLNSMTSNDVAIIDALTSWWSRDVEDRVKHDGWNAYLVTFMFHPIFPDGRREVRLKAMQDNICRFYSNLVTRVVRKPNSPLNLHKRPRMLAAPDYPVFKHTKIGIDPATINDGLHVHAILVVPLKSRLKVDVASHVTQKKFLYVKSPLRGIHFEPIENNFKRVTDYMMKSVKRGRCRWEDVFFLPKSPTELSR